MARRDAPALLERGATVVGSIWGRTVEEFAAAARAMRGAHVAALEVNVSCPNLEDRSRVFAHSASATADAVAASREAGVPLWVKLSPNTPDLVEIAGAALAAGAAALVLVNTVLGLGIDVERRRPVLGHPQGGVSGPGILPVSLRAVYDCRGAFADTPIVGVGGVARGEDAVAMLMAGADALEVGTATFADPRAAWRVQDGLAKWLRAHGVERVADSRGWPMDEGFGARLAARVGERGALCVGVDPSARLLESWGRADSVEGVEFAARALVEAVADVATAVKVQVGYFERFAAAGYRVLERVIGEARDAGLLVVGDVKRGDIPSTNEGYAQAWLGGGPLGVDALTVSPYLGVDSLAPFVRLARRERARRLRLGGHVQRRGSTVPDRARRPRRAARGVRAGIRGERQRPRRRARRRGGRVGCQPRRAALRPRAPGGTGPGARRRRPGRDVGGRRARVRPVRARHGAGQRRARPGSPPDPSVAR